MKEVKNAKKESRKGMKYLSMYETFFFFPFRTFLKKQSPEERSLRQFSLFQHIKMFHAHKIANITYVSVLKYV
jgi:hypothetical protein